MIIRETPKPFGVIHRCTWRSGGLWAGSGFIFLPLYNIITTGPLYPAFEDACIRLSKHLGGSHYSLEVQMLTEFCAHVTPLQSPLSKTRLFHHCLTALHSVDLSYHTEILCLSYPQLLNLIIFSQTLLLLCAASCRIPLQSQVMNFMPHQANGSAAAGAAATILPRRAAPAQRSFIWLLFVLKDLEVPGPLSMLCKSWRAQPCLRWKRTFVFAFGSVNITSVRP